MLYYHIIIFIRHRVWLLVIKNYISYDNKYQLHDEKLFQYSLLARPMEASPYVIQPVIYSHTVMYSRRVVQRSETISEEEGTIPNDPLSQLDPEALP